MATIKVYKMLTCFYGNNKPAPYKQIGNIHQFPHFWVINPLSPLECQEINLRNCHPKFISKTCNIKFNMLVTEKFLLP